MSLKATRVEYIRAPEGQQPGAYEIRGSIEEGGMAFRCPCGCGREGYNPFRTTENVEHPSWVWDGNADAPTLTPSILFVGGCQWHGFLTAGEWITV